MLAALFSGVLQWFLGMFGMSDAQKLGRAQLQNADLKAETKELEDGRKIETQVFTQPDGAADKWLHEHRSKQ